ncbi:hypothetical protein MOK15_20550 [Sphingobium sp. BYY-5]|uniref:hypothetical protein n=1 Tax=Sphingobium sp. BYY-5 TaxID=2926400 RepID=UPI001FA732E9|nr:hypothetical protein [Sphingobium sp. BYY-5]MCI4592457.1 hypothetical protein [Sphingobium sp. BYY-5]
MAQNENIDAQPDRRGATAFFPVAGIVPNVAKMLLVVPHFQAAMLKAAIGQQREAIAFMGQRCDEELKLVDSIGSATSITDVYSACLGFCQETAGQYAAEAGKVAELTSRNAMEAVRAVQQEAAKVAPMHPPREAA